MYAREEQAQRETIDEMGGKETLSSATDRERGQPVLAAHRLEERAQALGGARIRGRIRNGRRDRNRMRDRGPFRARGAVTNQRYEGQEVERVATHGNIPQRLRISLLRGSPFPRQWYPGRAATSGSLPIRR